MRIRALIAEGLGTFMMVFAGCGAIVVNQISGGTLSHLGVALVFGLVVLTVIYAYGDISGAHINPAVTIAFWAARRFPFSRVVPYILAQCIGAIFAAGTLAILLHGDHNLGATFPAQTAWQSFALEWLMTWWLMVVILGVSDGAKEKGIVAGMVIGAVIMLEAAFAGPISGASMNPARSLGPALVSGNHQHLWLYLVAPIGGSISAVFTCRLVGGPNCCPSNHLSNAKALV